MYDVVTLGEILIDCTPAPENEQGMPQFSCNPGGAPANVAAMVAKLGSIDLNILRHGSLKPQITEGIHRLYVEEVRESEVMLRGRGFKFLLPYEK